jgi:DnaK suppressor protein
MFASIFQFMGFPLAKPVHSRAEENRSETASLAVPPERQNQTLKANVSVPSEQKMPTRSPAVKAQASKTKASPPGKSVAAKPAKAGKVAPPAKAAKTPLKKAVPKPVAAKAVLPAKAKPAAKPAAKPMAKPSAKPIAKPAASAKASKAVKPTLPAKPVVTPKSKPVAPVAPVKAKAATTVVKPIPAKPTKSSEKVSPVSPKAAKAPSAPTPVKAPANEPVMTASGVPVRSGRPSSRLAQLTVPSMAQSVASTAAKASFTKMTAVQPIISPLASATKRNPKLANNWKTKAVEALTDDEIIAMPDDVYMNDIQMAFFRLKLEALKQGILNSAGKTTEHLREDTVVVPDPADRATIEEEHALELRTRDRERKLLKKIEQSIDRIDAGDYGYCDETGEPIGVGRLLARPTATLSLEAQQRRELKQKMFGD